MIIACPDCKKKVYSAFYYSGNGIFKPINSIFLVGEKIKMKYCPNCKIILRIKENEKK